MKRTSRRSRSRSFMPIPVLVGLYYKVPALETQHDGPLRLSTVLSPASRIASCSSTSIPLSFDRSRLVLHSLIFPGLSRLNQPSKRPRLDPSRLKHSCKGVDLLVSAFLLYCLVSTHSTESVRHGSHSSTKLVTEDTEHWAVAGLFCLGRILPEHTIVCTHYIPLCLYCDLRAQICWTCFHAFIARHPASAKYKRNEKHAKKMAVGWFVVPRRL
jgi:hypothetical protein